MTTTLTGKNQVTVPAEIVRDCGLQPGSRLDWRVGRKPGTIEVRVHMSVEQRLDRIQELGRSHRGKDLVADLVKMRKGEDAR